MEGVSIENCLFTGEKYRNVTKCFFVQCSTVWHFVHSFAPKNLNKSLVKKISGGHRLPSPSPQATPLHVFMMNVYKLLCFQVHSVSKLSSNETYWYLTFLENTKQINLCVHVSIYFFKKKLNVGIFVG